MHREKMDDDHPATSSFYFSTRGKVMCMLAAVNFFAYFDRSTAGLLILPMALELGWEIEVQGKVLSAFFCGYILTQLPSGVLAKRIGPRTVIGAT